MDWIMNKIEKLIKPLLDAEYERGFSAGVNAQILKEQEDHKRQLHDTYRYGYLNGKQDAECEIGTISLESLDIEDLKKEVEGPSEPFGFVGTMDDMTLVLEGSEA